jgi:hypothetical protein
MLRSLPLLSSLQDNPRAFGAAPFVKGELLQGNLFSSSNHNFAILRPQHSAVRESSLPEHLKILG